MTESATHYRDAWRSAIYDATGDYVKTQRAMELAELNGLFDPVDALARPAPITQCDAGSVDAIADVMVRDMFAPHELPLDAELAAKYLNLARKIAALSTAPGTVAVTSTDRGGPA